MKTDDLDRMDATARNGSAWPESTQSRADVLTLTAEVRRLAAELESVAAERDALRATMNDNAAVNALNAIASICGCPDWDYPGQLVRDVEALRTERDSARAEGRAADGQERHRRRRGSRRIGDDLGTVQASS
jgi:outer membrane murein-binding lipoprotein Lpp